MTTEDQLAFAIGELQRAKQTLRSDPQFALGCIGDARMAIAAAKVEIESPPTPLRIRIIKGPIISAAA